MVGAQKQPAKLYLLSLPSVAVFVHYVVDSPSPRAVLEAIPHSVLGYEESAGEQRILAVASLEVANCPLVGHVRQHLAHMALSLDHAVLEVRQPQRVLLALSALNFNFKT